MENTFSFGFKITGTGIHKNGQVSDFELVLSDHIDTCFNICILSEVEDILTDYGLVILHDIKVELIEYQTPGKK